MNLPTVVAWEVTNECNLACRHCKADARHIARGQQSTEQLQLSRELTTAEALAFIDNIATFQPFLIFTGGEPLLRRDVETLIEHAAGLNMRTALATNGLLIDEKRAQRLKACGLNVVSISVDYADACAHDTVRGIKGAHDSALKAVRIAEAAGMSVQINTTVTKANIGTLPAIRDMAYSSGAHAWHVFFLVPTGRGNVADLASLDDYYAALTWLEGEDNVQNSLSLRPTCAPQYRLREGRKGCLAGISYVFVSNDGTVQPCGYLPLNVGNIMEQDLAAIWQSSPVLKMLRTPFEWDSACRTCAFNVTCRGCRARAFATSGDYLGNDPYCKGVRACDR
ncbi:MAG: radical SAM protein [Halobacteriota archaeon]